MNRFRRLAIAACAVWVLGPAQAAGWPTEPVRFVVPFAPGGGIDIVARFMAERLAQKLGQPFMVENKAGAGTIIGTQAVAAAAPDGKTFLFTTNNLTINPSLYDKLPYDPKTAFTPVAMTAFHPLLLLVNPSLGIRSVADLVKAAKSRPDGLAYASVGNGSPQHLEMEIFKRALGLEITHVPYKGSAPAVSDLLAGNVQLMFNGISPTLQHVKAGKLSALGVDTPARAAVLPEVPSLAEAGLPEFRTISWSAIMAPAGTPPDIVAKMADTVEEILREPANRARLEAMGLQPSGLKGPALGRYLAAEQAVWAGVIAATGTRAE
jgi:tripartite-type tricarboxylate transporter receptor subunit TctC